MPTDTERREAARRLRECRSHIDAAGWLWLNGELDGAHVVASSEERLRRGTARLADLIEPSYDRDALLELADEMDMDAGCHAYVDDHDVYDYARRIREALGVEDFRPYMKACELRNRERGRITDGKVDE